LVGTVYEEAAHQLSRGSAELSVTEEWHQGEGPYSRFLTKHEGCERAWESGDSRYSLVVGDFISRETARAAFMEFMRHNLSWNIEVDGAMAVSREIDDSISVRVAGGHAAGSGATWGVVAGVAVGILFPPSVIASAAVAGVSGAGVAKHAVKKRAHDLGEALTVGTTTGHVRLLLLVNDLRTPRRD